MVLASQYLFFHKVTQLHSTGAGENIIWRQTIFTYSWPFATWGVFTWAQLASDRWALGLFSTTQDVGCYAVLFQLGYYPMSIVTAMALQLLAPIFFERAGDGIISLRNAHVSRLILRTTGMILGLSSIAFFFTLLFHEQLFHIFAAQEYAGISYLLPWMTLSGGIFAAGQTVSLNLMSQLRTNMMAVAKVATSSFGILLNFIGADFFSSTGIVFANLTFSICYTIWMFMISRKA
jgi:O-antigen/teichoic acid export membrane protein